MSKLRRALLAQSGGGDVYSLPEGYTECEYLSNNGSQYIELTYTEPYKFQKEWTGFDFKYQTHKLASGIISALIAGYANSSNQYKFTDAWINTNTQNQVSFSVGTYLSSKNMIFEPSEKEVHTISVSPIKGFYVDGIKVCDGWGRNAPTYDLRTRLWGTGAGNASLQSIYNGHAFIYYFRMNNGTDETVRLIPCLDTKKEPCMYDVINKNTFYNLGTGSFGYKIKSTGEEVEPIKG